MTDNIEVVCETKKEIGGPVGANIVANYILTLSNPEEGDIISHLKLQKLLYYSQGFHLAIHSIPLFNEKICHWEHGPVVVEVYRQFKIFGSGALKVDEGIDLSSLSDIQKETIKEVYDVYGQFSAWKLRQMTHEEEPWLSTKDGEEITVGSLETFFKSRINS